MMNEKGEDTNLFRYNDRLVLLVSLSGEPVIDRYGVSCHIYGELGQLTAICASGAYHNIYFNKDTRRVRVEIGPLTLTGGRYAISLLCWYGEGQTAIQADVWEYACSFNVECQPFRHGRYIMSSREGVCILPQSFSAADG